MDNENNIIPKNVCDPISDIKRKCGIASFSGICSKTIGGKRYKYGVLKKGHIKYFYEGRVYPTKNGKKVKRNS